MGKTKTGIFSLPTAQKYLTSKGTLRKKIGKPKLDIGIEFVIFAKIDKVSRSRKISHWKAWLQLTEHRHFDKLMKPHFQHMKKYKNNTKWRDLITDPDWKKTFYKNNIVRPRLIKKLKAIKFTYIDNKTN
jgi:hypothetical protein